MSADNYMYIDRLGDGFGVAMGFASDDQKPSMDHARVFSTYSEAVSFAMGEGCEYGFETSPEVNAIIARNWAQD